MDPENTNSCLAEEWSRNHSVMGIHDPVSNKVILNTDEGLFYRTSL